MAGEGVSQRLVREQSESRNIYPVDSNGNPMITITCAAAELIPTVQYGNVTVGPIVATVSIPKDFKGFNNEEKASIKKAIKEVQSICEEAVAEDRQSVHDLTRQSAEGRYSS